jgi:hypothetical protein
MCPRQNNCVVLGRRANRAQLALSRKDRHAMTGAASENAG